MSFNKAGAYHEAVVSAISKEMKKSKGDAEHLAEILTAHVAVLGRLIALLGEGNPQRIADLLETSKHTLDVFTASSTDRAKAMMEKHL